jgi:hypothetical protein
MQDIRDVEKEVKDIVNNRNKEEQNISLITPYHDIVRVKQEVGRCSLTVSNPC